jgi:hypothetical protein
MTTLRNCKECRGDFSASSRERGGSRTRDHRPKNSCVAIVGSSRIHTRATKEEARIMLGKRVTPPNTPHPTSERQGGDATTVSLAPKKRMALIGMIHPVSTEGGTIYNVGATPHRGNHYPIPPSPRPPRPTASTVRYLAMVEMGWDTTNQLRTKLPPCIDDCRKEATVAKKRVGVQIL